MTSEMYGRFPPVKELTDQLRNTVLPDLLRTPELYYESDIKRFKEDDLFVHKFIAHQAYLKFPNQPYKEIKDKHSAQEFSDIMDKSAEMVKEHLKWRKEFGVKDIKREEFPDEYFDRRGCYMFNEDLEGRKILVLKVKCLRKTKSGEKPLGERFVMYWVEHIHEHNDKGITIIIDCADAGLSNVNMDLVNFAHFIFKQHYPCFLGYFLVYNMPWIFEAVWNVIKRFLPKAGVERIKFVDNKSILGFIDETKVSVEMGGTDTKEYQYDICVKDKEITDTEFIENRMETIRIDS